MNTIIKFLSLAVNILVNNLCDYNFYQENMNLIKGVSRIWNVPIHLVESMNDSNLNKIITATRSDNNSDSGVCTIRYKCTDDCLLIIAVTVSKEMDIILF